MLYSGYGQTQTQTPDCVLYLCSMALKFLFQDKLEKNPGTEHPQGVRLSVFNHGSDILLYIHADNAYLQSSSQFGVLHLSYMLGQHGVHFRALLRAGSFPVSGAAQPLVLSRASNTGEHPVYPHEEGLI